jgi:16S rRNA (cytosine967-C5)-methyltransferase
MQKPPITSSAAPPTQIPLWRQLQGAAALLMAVRDGQSLTAALLDVETSLRPGVQALGFHALRWLGRAEALRQQLAKRPPPPQADALLCVALALVWNERSSAPTLVASRAFGDSLPLSQEKGANFPRGGPSESCWPPRSFAARNSLPPEGAAFPRGGPSENWASLYNDYTLVDQAVEAAKRSEATNHQASFINGCLRRFLREREALVAKTDQNPQAVWNHPQWWIDRLRKDHPQQWQSILRASNAKAPLVLRINKLKTSVPQYIRALAAINIVANEVGDGGVILATAHPVPSLPGYADGHFSVQDAAAQIAAPLLLDGLLPAATTQLKVLDACAAPGGKTGHLLELLGDRGVVTAIDINAQRCKTISQNLARLGLAANVVVGDASRPADWWDGELFDAILLDAPCTASGIVRRHPDVRWLRRPGDIAQLAQEQAKLLNTLWALLKPRGRMVYCTCSIFRAEGDLQAETFVANHNDAVLMPSPGHMLPQSSPLGEVFPDNLLCEHDGFYYALLEKQPA